MTRLPRELLEFLYRYDPAVQSLALGLRKVVHEEIASCHEYIFAMRSKVVLQYGICNINVFARHVLLGFPRGTDLDEPAGVLQGTGKAMRHITLKKLSDLDRPEIREYLRRARKRAGLKRRVIERLASCDEGETEVANEAASSSTWTRVRLRNLTFIKGRSAGSLPMAWTAVSQQAFGRWDYQPSRAMKTALHHKLAQRLILSILSS